MLLTLHSRDSFHTRIIYFGSLLSARRVIYAGIQFHSRSWKLPSACGSFNFGETVFFFSLPNSRNVQREKSSILHARESNEELIHRA